MSLLTRFLRALGEGGVLEAIEAAEKDPTNVSADLSAIGAVASAVGEIATLVGAKTAPAV
jgi:hypothetical protein